MGLILTFAATVSAVPHTKNRDTFYPNADSVIRGKRMPQEGVAPQLVRHSLMRRRKTSPSCRFKIPV